MALEFDVKLRNPFLTGSLVAAVTTHLRLFGAPGDLGCDQASDARWGDSERVGVVRLGGAVATLLCHKAGEEAELGSDGGFWLTVDAAKSRTGAGFLLASVVAIAAAEAAGSTVLDESGLFKLGRFVTPSDAVAQLQHLAGCREFDQACARLAQVIGLM